MRVDASVEKVDIGVYEQEMDFESAKKRIVTKDEYPPKQ